jgi:hypothetical protein
MALQKNKIAIPLNSGVETGVDDKQQPLGQFRRLENVVFDITGKVQKRNGYDAIPLKNLSNESITNSTTLTSFKSELNLIADNQFYGRVETLNRWDQKGNVFSAIPSSTNILRNNISQKNVDSVHVQGLDAFVFEDDEGVHLSVVDNINANFILSNVLLSASGTLPKIVQRNGTIYCFFVESTTIKYRKFSIFDFNNISTSTNVITTLDATNKIYDVESIDDQLIIALNTSTASGTLGFIKIDADDNIGSIIEVSGQSASNAISIHGDSASRVVCSYASSTAASAVVFNITLGVKILNETVVETISNVKTITIHEKDAGSYTCFYEISDTETYNHYIKSNTIDLAATVGTASVLKRSLGLASKAFKYDSELYITTLHQNTLQSTHFIVKEDGQIITKLSPSQAGSLLDSGSVPHITSIDENEFLLGSQIKGRLVEDNGTFFSLLGVNRSIINFAPASKFENATLADNLHIAGGFLKMYDGQSVVEHGFHLFPEGLEAGSTATTGGFISDGQYEYIALYAWSDAQGNIHRSAASIALPLTLSGATATQTQEVVVPSLRLTSKENVIIELYRTEAAGTIFYKVSSTANPPTNDTTVNTITITDTTSDADLINNEILYTTGNVLENIPAPASDLIESFKNRIFVTNSQEDRLYYSKITNEGFAVEFNDTLQIAIPEVGGNTTAIKTMDDKLIVFKRDAIYFISGDGPNNLGEQDTFIEPELISSEIGCINETSVILFKSQKGIYQLSRSLSLTYIGAAVEDYNDLTITSAVVVADKNQVRFTTSDGECIVYNYYQKKWATFTNHKGISAIDIEDDYFYLRTDNLVYKESSHYSDNGTPIKTRIETGWLNFAGVQAFQRVYRMLLLGEFKSAHKLRIKVAYDFIDAYIQELTVDSSDVIDPTTYGSYSPYGAESTYGASNQYQIRVDFKRQKCETIRVCIEDILEIPGESLDISSLLFIVGAKVGEYKNSESKQFGTK